MDPMTIPTKHRTAGSLAKSRRLVSSRKPNELARVSFHRRQNSLLTAAALPRFARRRLFKNLHTSPQTYGKELTHGVELTDDVWVLDKQGRRIPPPAYAVLTIDKLPRFQ